MSFNCHVLLSCLVIPYFPPYTVLPVIDLIASSSLCAGQRIALECWSECLVEIKGVQTVSNFFLLFSFFLSVSVQRRFSSVLQFTKAFWEITFLVHKGGTLDANQFNIINVGRWLIWASSSQIALCTCKPVRNGADFKFWPCSALWQVRSLLSWHAVSQLPLQRHSRTGKCKTSSSGRKVTCWSRVSFLTWLM